MINMEFLKLVDGNVIANKNYLIMRYLNYIDVSVSTQKEYYSGLKMFFDYCKRSNVNDIERKTIIEYRDYLRDEGKSANTINLYLVSVKNFFKWLEFEGIYKDVTKNIKAMPVQSQHIRESLDIYQIKELLRFCQDDKERLIISLAITTGIRCNEMCNIRIQDIVNKNGSNCLYVLGKARQGMRTDYVTISDDILKQIKEYIKKYNITEYLFTSNSNNSKGKTLSTRSMREIVNKIYERAGIKNNNLVFHSLRHSFCNINLKSGNDITEISKAMRHRNITTTMRYVKDIEAENNKCFNTVNDLLFAAVN